MNSFRRDAELARGYRQYFAVSEFEMQIRQRFDNEEQVIDELFEIEINAWTRVLDSVKSRSDAPAIQNQ
jgi:hypothetical protein